jgi:sugar (pentulose or hexulose) kinase
MPYFCGVDIGASAAKLVIVDESGRIVAKSLRRCGVDYADAAERCLAERSEEHTSELQSP